MMIYYSIVILLIAAIMIQGIYIALVYFGKAKTKVPYLPIPQQLLPEIYSDLNLADNSVLYDLGCGDSKVLRYCIKKNTGIKAIGIEWAVLPFFISKIWNLIFPLKNLSLLRKNFYTIPVTDATHIFIYLLPEPLEQLFPKFKHECKSGTIVVSCNYPFRKMNYLIKNTVSVSNKTFTLYTYQF